MEVKRSYLSMCLNWSQHKGMQGDQGEPGNPGADGQGGDPGPKGAKGRKGPAGRRGECGDKASAQSHECKKQMLIILPNFRDNCYKLQICKSKIILIQLISNKCHG